MKLYGQDDKKDKKTNNDSYSSLRSGFECNFKFIFLLK